MPRRWQGEGLAVALAHAGAFVLVARCHYAVRPPNRLVWVLAELGLALAFWLPSRLYLARVLRPTYLAVAPGRRWLFAALPAALGGAGSRWWAGTFEDTLWVLPPAGADVWVALLAASEAVVLAAGFAGLLAATVAVAGDEPAPTLPGPVTIARPPLPRRMAVPAVCFALFVAAAGAFAAWFVGQERTLYYWDYITYWSATYDLADALRTRPPGEVWGQFRHVTRSADYGPAPAVPPAVAAVLFGDSRVVYVVTIVAVYLTALAAATWLFVRRFAPDAGAVGVIVPLLVVLLGPTAWFPLVRGYLDVGGAAIAVFALLVYLSRPAGGLPWRRVVVLGGLLAAMTLFRRWYSFFVVAFALVAGVDTAVAAVRGWRERGPREAARRVGTLALAGGWAAVAVVSTAPGWVVRAATIDYADAYAAYKTVAPLADRARGTLDDCGPGAVALAAVSAAVLLRWPDTRRPAAVVAATAPVMLLHFLRVQEFGPHHQCLFLPALVLLPSLALVRVLGAAPVWARWAGPAGVAAVGGVAMAAGFVPTARPVHDALRPAVSALYFPPLTRDDLPECRRLLRYADDEAGRAGGGRVAVVASSLALNPTMFLAADRSLGEPVFRPGRLVTAGEADRAAGFPGVVLRADVVVVADPPQTHLRPDEQQGTVIVADDLLRGTGIGVGYDPLPETFHLTGGVTVRLYRRARPIPHAEFEAFCARLRRAHPDHPGFFTPPPGLDDELRFPRPPRP